MFESFAPAACGSGFEPAAANTGATTVMVPTSSAGNRELRCMVFMASPHDVFHADAVPRVDALCPEQPPRELVHPVERRNLRPPRGGAPPDSLRRGGAVH